MSEKENECAKEYMCECVCVREREEIIKVREREREKLKKKDRLYVYIPVFASLIINMWGFVRVCVYVCVGGLGVCTRSL